MATTTPTFTYNPFSHEAWTSPYSAYAHLRNEEPIYYNEELDWWFVSRYDDCVTVARDYERFSVEGGIDTDGGDHLVAGGGIQMNEMNPPEHAAYRKAMQEWWTPKWLRGYYGEKIGKEAAVRVAALKERSSFDLSMDLSWQLATSVAVEVLGLPAEDRELINRWIVELSSRQIGDPNLTPDAERAASEIGEYVAEQMRLRDKNPTDDLLMSLMRAEVDGSPLDREKSVSLGTQFLFGLSGTTHLQLANALYLFAENPDERRFLVENPDAIPAAFEECIRYESTVQHIKRLVVKQTEIHGATIPSGATVVILLAAGNRDERVWDEGEVFRASRPRGRQLGFSEGVHVCIGAPLVRLEAKILLTELLQEMPNFELTGTPDLFPAHQFRGFWKLPAMSSGKA